MKGGPYLGDYEARQGLPVIVGPFDDYYARRHFVEGSSVDEGRYSRAWVAPITAPAEVDQRVSLGGAMRSAVLTVWRPTTLTGKRIRRCYVTSTWSCTGLVTSA